MKMFTFFECDAVCLLYLLNNVFGSIQVMKPATSKEGNSEVYVVCCGFKGEEEVEPYLNNLMYISMCNYSVIDCICSLVYYCSTAT